MDNHSTPAPDARSRIRGCLLGGALGDALGAPVEFMSLTEIRATYGPDGIREPDGDPALITDDTQMTLFTAQGMLAGWARFMLRGLGDPSSTTLQSAYRRWLTTQGYEWHGDFVGNSDILSREPRMNVRRAPGNTCLAALIEDQWDDSFPFDGGRPTNNSKGCGAVMRAAPVAMVGHEAPFKAGVVSGAITHGHPGGYLPAGFLAHLVSDLLVGKSLLASIGETQLHLVTYERGREVEVLITEAVDLASNNADPDSAIKRLGEGWTGDEALAIALYCALAANDFESTVRLAANHGGDSDSTAAIAGNIAGAMYGYQALPADWLNRLELVDLIEMVASDLSDVHLDQADLDHIGHRYSDWA